MKERNHFYIYTLDPRIHSRMESQNIQIYVNALHSISLSFRPVLTQRARHFEQVFKTEKSNNSFPAGDTKYIVKGTTASAFYWLLTYSKDFIISWQRLAAVDGFDSFSQELKSCQNCQNSAKLSGLPSCQNAKGLYQFNKMHCTNAIWVIFSSIRSSYTHPIYPSNSQSHICQRLELVSE